MTNVLKISQVDDVKGYSLFNDMEDEALRTKNRARVMVNIFEDNLKRDGNDIRISPAGMVVLMSYFKEVPEDERRGVYEQFQSLVKDSYNVVQ